MKTIFSSRKNHYLKRVGFLLIVVALVAAIVSCNGGPAPTRYNLTMAVAPPGSGTAIDVTGASAYEAGTVVNINAVPAAGYQFVKWTAPAGTFADPNAATTTFTMPAQNVTVTANFVGPLDHFKGYWIDPETATDIKEEVYLEDQFVALTANVTSAEWFGNPVEKWHDDVLTPISNPDHHLTIYGLDYEEEPQVRYVEVDNQFGIQELTVLGPVALVVPTQKLEPGDHEPPLRLDHFLLYKVVQGPSVDPVVVVLNDQFGGEPDATVYEPRYLANPVRKTHGTEVTEIVDPDAHLVFYAIDIEDEPFQTQVQVVNQFGEQTFGVLDPVGLAVPSTKTELPPPEPLDHFKCYDVEDFVGSGDIVSLEDQFSEPFLAQVGYAWDFCNPVEKIHGDMVTPILHPDNHLMLFDIYHETTFACWEVEVYNQFGLQLIEVGWPFGLAVPTHKLFPGDHDPPAGLDHFLIYEAWGPPINVVVSLDDQFHLEPEVLVMEPVLFGIPVVKTHEDIVTPIGNERMHLVFYEISGDSYEGFVAAENQFGGWELPVWSPELLAVPSLKWGYWPLECPY